MTWVVAYDISNARCRARVARRLAARGIRLQKSVFLVEGAPRVVRQLTREMAKMIDLKTDRVCAWPLMDSWRDKQFCFPPEAAPLVEEFIVV